MWVSFSNYSLRAVNVLGRHHPGNWLATLERKIRAENKKTLKNPGKTPSDDGRQISFSYGCATLRREA
jgi:hypothetical protein